MNTKCRVGADRKWARERKPPTARAIQVLAAGLEALSHFAQRSSAHPLGSRSEFLDRIVETSSSAGLVYFIQNDEQLDELFPIPVSCVNESLIAKRRA